MGSEMCIRDSDQPEQTVWPGFKLVLYRDACERYWHALIGDKPLVYVVMQEDEADGSVEPALVTLDYDEALAYAETDATVLSAPITPSLYQLMERFVLQNYQPVAFKKRKRRNWSEESEGKSGEQSADKHAGSNRPTDTSGKTGQAKVTGHPEKELQDGVLDGGNLQLGARND